MSGRPVSVCFVDAAFLLSVKRNIFDYFFWELQAFERSGMGFEGFKLDVESVFEFFFIDIHRLKLYNNSNHAATLLDFILSWKVEINISISKQ